MKYFILFFWTVLASPCFAGLFGEFNGYYNSDTFTTSSDATDSKIYYGIDIYANLENKHKFFAGFHVDQWNLQATSGSTETTLTSLNMGPMFLWIMDRRKIFSLAAGYCLVANGTYNTGGTETELTGTSLFGTIAAMPEVAENFFIGIKLNYYSLNYSRSTSGTTTAEVAYTRNLIFPSISFAWRN